MRRFIDLLVLVAVGAAVGCGGPDTKYTGPAITPLVGKNVPKGYGDPAVQGPTGPPVKMVNVSKQPARK